MALTSNNIEMIRAIARNNLHAARTATRISYGGQVKEKRRACRPVQARTYRARKHHHVGHAGRPQGISHRRNAGRIP